MEVTGRSGEDETVPHLLACARAKTDANYTDGPAHVKERMHADRLNMPEERAGPTVGNCFVHARNASEGFVRQA